MVKHLYLLSSSLIIASCGALGLSAQDCNLRFGGHGSSGVPFKLADGLVASEAGNLYAEGEPYSYQSFLDIVDCRSGESAQMIYSLIEYPTYEFKDAQGKQIVSDQKYPEFREAVAAEEKLDNLDRVEELAIAFGYSVYLSVVHQGGASESCGCRVFFPELRGEKERYEA